MTALQWHHLRTEPILLDALIQAARDGRVLVAKLDGPRWPYPIVRVRLEAATAGLDAATAEDLGLDMEDLCRAHTAEAARLRAENELLNLPKTFAFSAFPYQGMVFDHDEDVTVDWQTLSKTIAGWKLPTEDENTLYHHLHRVFGDNPDSAQKAKDWLHKANDVFHAAPEALMRGNILNVPQDIGLPWVLSYLKDCRGP